MYFVKVSASETFKFCNIQQFVNRGLKLIFVSTSPSLFFFSIVFLHFSDNTRHAVNGIFCPINQYMLIYVTNFSIAQSHSSLFFHLQPVFSLLILGMVYFKQEIMCFLFIPVCLYMFISTLVHLINS